MEEIILDDKGKQLEREVTRYEGEFRQEKFYYNSRDKLYKKKVYVYEYYE